MAKPILFIEIPSTFSYELLQRTRDNFMSSNPGVTEEYHVVFVVGTEKFWKFKVVPEQEVSTIDLTNKEDGVVKFTLPELIAARLKDKFVSGKGE